MHYTRLGTVTHSFPSFLLLNTGRTVANQIDSRQSEFVRRPIRRSGWKQGVVVSMITMRGGWFRKGIATQGIQNAKIKSGSRKPIQIYFFINAIFGGFCNCRFVKYHSGRIKNYLGRGKQRSVIIPPERIICCHCEVRRWDVQLIVQQRLGIMQHYVSFPQGSNPGPMFQMTSAPISPPSLLQADRALSAQGCLWLHLQDASLMQRAWLQEPLQERKWHNFPQVRGERARMLFVGVSIHAEAFLKLLWWNPSMSPRDVETGNWLLV